MCYVENLLINILQWRKTYYFHLMFCEIKARVFFIIDILNFELSRITQYRIVTRKSVYDNYKKNSLCDFNNT